jgi:hypothetical protein
MATYHVSIKVAKKDDTHDMRASSHFAYIVRTGQFEQLKIGEELIYVESGNMPSWSETDPSVFWLASDTFERKNGAVYRELEAALPRELSTEQQRNIVDIFIEQVLDTTHPYSFAIHSKLAADGLPQPHVHLMWSERRMDGKYRDPAVFFKRAAAARRGKDGRIKNVPEAVAGGCKKISMYHRIDEFRRLWEELINEAYRGAGMSMSVSHSSLKNQGISRKPERYLGPTRMRGENRNVLNERRRAFKDAERAEDEALRIIKLLAKMRSQQSIIQELLFSMKTINGMDKRNMSWVELDKFSIENSDRIQVIHTGRKLHAR